MTLEPALLPSRSLNAAVLALALIAGGCDRQSEAPAQPQASGEAAAKKGVVDRSHKGAPIPDFTLKDNAGDALKLPTLAGKPTLVNLWATWCAPCVVELPTLDKLAGRTGTNLRVVTVSQDAGRPERVQAFLHERGLDRLPGWLDPMNDLSFHYATGTLPTSVLYDAQGKEVWRYVGELDWTGPDAAKLLAEAGA